MEEKGIRSCCKEDLAQVAEIHKSQFAVPGALLGHLSTSLIAQFYAGFLHRAIFLVHTTDGAVDGFVLGGQRAVLARCRSSLFRRSPLLGLADVGRRPHLWPQALRYCIRLVRGTSASNLAIEPRSDLRMISLAVAPHATRKGIATALVDAFETTLRGMSPDYELSVLKGNLSAISFYERLAFRRVRETATSWVLRKDLTIADHGQREVPVQLSAAIDRPALGLDGEGKPTVFVIDDDPEVRDSLAWLLQQADLVVHAYASGPEFLSAYRPGRAECLVLDVRMPGMSGLEVQQELLKRAAELPVIFLTAYGDPATRARAFRQGAFDFLEKPVDDALLLKRIGSTVGYDAENGLPN
jgi:CheY-like chemotaxis protein